MSRAPRELRRAWCEAQGLTRPAGRAVGQVLAETGWVRTLGGADGYLSLAARCPGLKAGDVHAALASGAIRAVPAVRGCVYLVPKEHAQLARTIAAELSARRRARELEKVGVGAAELEQVCLAVEAALASGAATVHALKKRLPEDAVRHLGAAGKKIGLTTTLTPALRQLELAGRLERRLADHRLDHERYTYALPAPGSEPQPPLSPSEATQRMVSLTLRWLAPTTAARIAAFSGLTKTACSRALQAIGARELPVPLDGQPAFTSADAPSTAPPHGTSLLPGLDNLLAWQGPAAFVAPEDLDREIARWGRQKGSTWGTAKHVLSRCILVDGLVVGEWEWDPAREELVLGSYGGPLPEAVHAEAAARTQLISELGTARAFSLETDAQLIDRAARVRALAS